MFGTDKALAALIILIILPLLIAIAVMVLRTQSNDYNDCIDSGESHYVCESYRMRYF
jgi:hypothetical protein